MLKFLIPIPESEIPIDYYYILDYYFENCMIGEVYSEFTYKLVSFGINFKEYTHLDKSLRTKFTLNSSYNPIIIYKY